MVRPNCNQLILRFSAKKPSSGSDASPFRKITTLLYKAATGRTVKDLERSCNIVLSAYRDLMRVPVLTHHGEVKAGSVAHCAWDGSQEAVIAEQNLQRELRKK